MTFFVQEVFPRKSLSSLVHVVAHFPNTSVNSRTQQLPPFLDELFQKFIFMCGKIKVQNAYTPFLPCCWEFDIQVVHLVHNVKWTLYVQQRKIESRCTLMCTMYNNVTLTHSVYSYAKCAAKYNRRVEPWLQGSPQSTKGRFAEQSRAEQSREKYGMNGCRFKKN